MSHPASRHSRACCVVGALGAGVVSTATDGSRLTEDGCSLVAGPSVGLLATILGRVCITLMEQLAWSQDRLPDKALLSCYPCKVRPSCLPGHPPDSLASRLHASSVSLLLSIAVDLGQSRETVQLPVRSDSSSPEGLLATPHCHSTVQLFYCPVEAQKCLRGHAYGQCGWQVSASLSPLWGLPLVICFHAAQPWHAATEGGSGVNKGRAAVHGVCSLPEPPGNCLPG